MEDDTRDAAGKPEGAHTSEEDVAGLDGGTGGGDPGGGTDVALEMSSPDSLGTFYSNSVVNLHPIEAGTPLASPKVSFTADSPGDPAVPARAVPSHAVVTTSSTPPVATPGAPAAAPASVAPPGGTPGGTAAPPGGEVEDTTAAAAAAPQDPYTYSYSDGDDTPQTNAQISPERQRSPSSSFGWRPASTTARPMPPAPWSAAASAPSARPSAAASAPSVAPGGDVWPRRQTLTFEELWNEVPAPTTNKAPPLDSAVLDDAVWRPLHASSQDPPRDTRALEYRPAERLSRRSKDGAERPLSSAGGAVPAPRTPAEEARSRCSGTYGPAPTRPSSGTREQRPTYTGTSARGPTYTGTSASDDPLSASYRPQSAVQAHLEAEYVAPSADGVSLSLPPRGAMSTRDTGGSSLSRGGAVVLTLPRPGDEPVKPPTLSSPSTQQLPSRGAARPRSSKKPRGTGSSRMLRPRPLSHVPLHRRLGNAGPQDGMGSPSSPSPQRRPARGRMLRGDTTHSPPLDGTPPPSASPPHPPAHAPAVSGTPARHSSSAEAASPRADENSADGVFAKAEGTGSIQRKRREMVDAFEGRSPLVPLQSLPGLAEGALPTSSGVQTLSLGAQRLSLGVQRLSLDAQRLSLGAQTLSSHPYQKYALGEPYREGFSTGGTFGTSGLQRTPISLISPFDLPIMDSAPLGTAGRSSLGPSSSVLVRGSASTVARVLAGLDDDSRVLHPTGHAVHRAADRHGGLSPQARGMSSTNGGGGHEGDKAIGVPENKAIGVPESAYHYETTSAHVNDGAASEDEHGGNIGRARYNNGGTREDGRGGDARHDDGSARGYYEGDARNGGDDGGGYSGASGGHVATGEPGEPASRGEAFLSSDCGKEAIMPQRDTSRGGGAEGVHAGNDSSDATARIRERLRDSIVPMVTYQMEGQSTNSPVSYMAAYRALLAARPSEQSSSQDPQSCA